MGLKSTIKGGARFFVDLFKEKKIFAVPADVGMGELLKGKTALITGGSEGIGLAIAKDFIKNGAKVIIASRDEQKLKRCVAEIGSSGRIGHIVLDVQEVSSFTQKIEEASELFPDDRIDILVNSAGIVVKSTFFDIEEKEYDSIMDTNAKGTYFMCQAMARYMIENKIKGHILNVSSSSALRPAWTPYQMSKWSVRGLTLGVADLLLPYGIVVNAIGPGPTFTSMLGKSEGDSMYNAVCPAGRFASPEEIAHLAVFMVSDCGDLIVGDTFYMTGGSGTISCHR
ncbi:SDR family NAD(P)-dependent oxidoreductase [uncultured Oscillibacter sp.]|uniref:SDR family NAD(P)-dependent oxidoreductase n=1 Tax=uncultured Oscillibacter sp. TaxID=876091 RepID=UPI00262359D5|nr:SDR family oxidoreductase [uncultured Oscillibacter sp.]